MKCNLTKSISLDHHKKKQRTTNADPRRFHFHEDIQKQHKQNPKDNFKIQLPEFNEFVNAKTNEFFEIWNIDKVSLNMIQVNGSIRKALSMVMKK